MRFAGEDLYPTLAAKAATLGYSLIANHPILDGSKRVGHAAMEAMLLLNGLELSASVGEGEKFIIAVASRKASRDDLRAWVEAKVVPKQS